MDETTCRHCGRLRESNKTCPCILESIHSIFVNAPDQSRGSISSIRSYDESNATDSRTPASETQSSVSSLVWTPYSTRSTRSSVSQASRQSRAPFRRYASVNTRPMQQMQMLSSFLNDYFPSAEARAGLANRRSYLAGLPDIDTASMPLLRIAIDTLCYAHVGTKTKDQRLIRESQASYGKVLSYLIDATSRESSEVSRIEPKAVITSIMLLCLYEDSIPIPYQGQKGTWAAHYWGCQQLLKAYGTSFLDMRQPMDRLIFWNLRMPLFFLGISRRQAIVLGQEEWLDMSDSIPESRGPLTEFYRLGMKVPALLERTDKCLRQGANDDDLEDLVGTVVATRDDVVAWFDRKSTPPIGAFSEIPELIDVEEISAFDMQIEEHCYMTSSETFREFFTFRAPRVVLKNHTMKTMCCLVLNCTLLRLLHFRPSSQRFLAPETAAGIKHLAHESAVDISRSLHHYSSSDNLAMADFTEFLIDLALNFFEESGAAKELGWCIAIRCATQLRRERIKSTIQPRTLCRMGDIGPGFAAAMKYRTTKLTLEPA